MGIKHLKPADLLLKEAYYNLELTSGEKSAQAKYVDEIEILDNNKNEIMLLVSRSIELEKMLEIAVSFFLVFNKDKKFDEAIDVKKLIMDNLDFFTSEAVARISFLISSFTVSGRLKPIITPPIIAKDVIIKD